MKDDAGVRVCSAGVLPPSSAQCHVDADANVEVALRSVESHAAAQRRWNDPHLITLTDNLPVLIAYLDHEQRFRFSNRLHREWWGRESTQILGRSLIEVIGPINFAEARQHLSAAYSGTRVTFKSAVHYPVVGARFVEVTYAPHLSEEGSVQGIFILVKDISEAKRFEETLRRNERERQILFDTVPAFIWYKDLNDRIVRLNRPAAATIGRPVEEIEGRPVADLYPDAERYHRDDLEVIQSGRPKMGIIEPLLTGSGERIWLRTDKLPYRNERGEVTGVVVFSVDITAQKKADDSLRESEARYRRLVESTGVIPWEFDIASGRFSFISSEVVHQLGYPIESWYQEGFWEQCLHPEDRERALEVCRRESSVQSFNFNLEYRIRAADGSLRWFRDLVYRMHDQSGRAFLQGVFIDITEQRRLEEENRRIEQQRRESQKMEALGTLAGGIAHDFNNLLGGILGYTECAIEGLGSHSSMLGQYLERVRVSALRARDLVQQILTFSRRGPQVKIPVRVSEVISEVTGILSVALPPSVRVVQQLESEECWVCADPSDLYQVILNLMTNAAHAMRTSGGELRVRLAQERNGGEIPTVVIEVQDTGEGIAPEIQSRIFEPYFTTKPKGEGTGLGLAVVHGIVSSLGGEVEVCSELGKGATFSVQLPGTAAGVAESPPLRSGPVRGNGRILFVDDEEFIADLGATSLRSLGYEVVACCSSIEALRIFEHEPFRFDLIVSDYSMPGLSGVELAGECRRLNPVVRVLLCSGGQLPPLTPGIVDGTLRKPYSLATLSLAVDATSRGTGAVL